MAEFSLQALHDEIEADPAALGYKEAGGEWKGDSMIADLINAKDLVIDKTSVPMEDARALVTYDAYNNLLADRQEWLVWMTPNSGNLRILETGLASEGDVKLQLTGRTLASNGVAGTGQDSLGFWAAADDQDMAPAMLALIEVPGSRAEVLWGEGQTISIGNVGHAANL